MTLLKRSPLAKVQGQLDTLQSEAATLSHPERFMAELEELQSRLAELEVAYEELETQNEELLSTREALENQRHRYRRLFDEAPFGYLVTDPQGVIEEANRAASLLLGVPQHHLAGKPLLLYLMPQERRGFRDVVAQARAGELPGEREVRIKPRT
ncbi:MAG: PAS domain-containing protein, partial [Thermoanaerobaculia bacterium]